MGLFSKKKDSVTPQEIVMMAQAHEPNSIYDADRQLLPVVEDAVTQIMPFYDGISNVATMLMLNDPAEMKENMNNADVDTLLIFFKFLAIKAGESANNQSIGAVQHYLISVLQKKLS